MKFATSLLAAALAAAVPVCAAVESDPLPVPQGGTAARAIEQYNQGVALLLSRHFAEAQRRFEAALHLDDTLAEAHNNLAFALRMQGAQNFGRSLLHYDRAIALKPALAQAYMYRGMLFVQQGDRKRAEADLQHLLRLDAALAEELRSAIEGRAGPDRNGITGQYN